MSVTPSFETLIEDTLVECFHDAQSEPYVTVKINSSVRNFHVYSSECRDYLSQLYYAATGKGLIRHSLEAMLSNLSARCKFTGKERKVPIRVAGDPNEKIEIDHSDGSSQSIHITRHEIAVKEAVAKFLRPAGSQALPSLPDIGDLDALWKLLNLEEEKDRILLASWMVMAMRPTGPYPILVIHGGQGSAKTTAMRYIRSLIDPVRGDTANIPRSERDLFVMASRSWIMSFDNLSFLKHDLSDALCRLATTGSYRHRKLRTDGEEFVIEACRPLILNGIEDIITRPDLLSRSIVIHFPVIPDEKRLTLTELDKRFEEDRPKVIRALAEGVQSAMKRYDQVQKIKPPRLADFAFWATAAERGLGFNDGSVIQALEQNQLDAIRTAVELDPVAQAIIEHMRKKDEWSGTITDLIVETEPSDKTPYNWPKTPTAFSGQLSRIEPALRKLDIVITKERSAEKRLIMIEKLSVSAPSDFSEDDNYVFEDQADVEYQDDHPF